MISTTKSESCPFLQTQPSASGDTAALGMPYYQLRNACCFQAVAAVIARCGGKSEEAVEQMCKEEGKWMNWEAFQAQHKQRREL